MDPVTAIGLASSILTFIEFSWELVTGAYEISKSTTGSTLENTHIGSVIEDLERVTEDLIPDLEPTTKHGKALRQLAERCNKLSKDLSRILKKLQASDKGWKWQSLHVKLASLRKEKEIALIEKRLDQYRSQIVMRLSAMLSEQQSLLKIELDKIQAESSHLLTESANHFAFVRTRLDGGLQDILSASSESPDLKCKSEAEQIKSLKDVRSALGQLQTMIKLVPRENRILRRLYFKSMYNREDAVEDAQSGTFTWIVETDERSDNQDGLYKETAMKHKSLSQAGEDSYIQEVVETEQMGPETEPVGNEFDIGTQEHSRREEGIPKEPAEITDIPESEGKDEDGSDTQLRDRTRHSFLTWLATGDGIHHISGKAGSGKSTLMKFLSCHPRVRSELKTWAGAKQLIFIHIFFWNSGDRLQMSIEGLYRTILYEALKQCPELIPQIFPIIWGRLEAEAHGLDDIPIRLPELKSAFNTLVENESFPKHRFCFFTDGLDEFEGDSFQHWELARSLQSWTKSSDIKICVSSRPHTEFMVSFSDDYRLRIYLHEVTSSDISQFALAMFKKTENFVQYKDIYADLVQDIVEMADGVFLWARLVVRSLLDGIGNRHSISALSAKLNALPRDLGKLFDNLLEAIDPGDRGTSDKLLLIAAFAARLNHPINGIMLTWIDDLQDPRFPFSSPVQSCLDEDIHKRHKDLRCQLHSLSRGLLEMTTNRFHEDIFLKFNVQFFHRSVRDYLEQPSRKDEMQSRIPDFDASDAYMRLKLAEFKFWRSKAADLDVPSPDGFGLFFCLHQICARGLKMSSQEAHIEILEECGRVLDSHRRQPFSYPLETKKNSGHILWGRTLDTTPPYGEIDDSVHGFSYTHWVINWDNDGYVRKLVSEDHKLVDGSQEITLLLTAALLARQETVAILLERGAKPHQHVLVREGKNQSEDVWMIFLVLLAEWSLQGWYHDLVVERFQVLECFLKFGVDSEIFFLLYQRQYKGADPHSESTVTNNTKRPETIEVPDDELLLLTLRQLVQLYKAPNYESIIDLLLKKESSSLWGQTKRAISNFSSWTRSSSLMTAKYRAFDANELGSEHFWLHSVHSRTSQTHPGFKVRVS